MTRKARILHQSALGEGDRLVAGDDEVIEDLDVDERQRVLEAAGQQLVRLARLRRAGGVVVGEDHRRRVHLEGRLDDLPRVNAGLRQRAAEGLVEADDPVRVLEEERECDGFTYVWDQDKYNPITGEGLFHIHFKFKDGSRIRKAFSYDWRIWTLPEITEMLAEAGFSPSVYWEGTGEDGEGNGEFSRTTEGEADRSWIAYVVAEK